MQAKFIKLFWLVAVGIFAAGCSRGIVRPKVEKGIEAALPEYIGPAKEYEVEVEGSTNDILNGHMDCLKINGKSVQLEGNLTIEELIVYMDHVKFDPRSRKLLSVGATNFTATVAEAAVNHYIKSNRENETELTVAFEPKRVAVKFVPKVAGIAVLVEITGKPEITGTDKINFVADKGALAHIPVPALVVNKALERVNPILDMSFMKFPVNLTKITVKKNAVTVSGKAHFKP